MLSVLESCLAWRGDLVQPVKDMKTATKASLAPLTCVVVSINEPGDKKFGVGENSETGCMRKLKLVEQALYVVAMKSLVHVDNAAFDCHDQKAIVENLYLRIFSTMNYGSVES